MEHMPSEPTSTREQLTAVVHYPATEEEAGMLAAMLEANGIPSAIRSLRVPMDGAMLSPVGSPWGVIEVRQVQAQEAASLIRDYLSVQDQITDSPDDLDEED